MTLLVLVMAIVGLLVGSFLNVVIWRVPRGESIVSPPSHCPGCDRPVRPRDNIPVLSWLLLRGRCRDCGQRISIRYPLVEAATAAVFAVLTLRIGVDAALPAFLYLGAIGVALAMIDLDVKRLPNSIVLPSYVVGSVLLAAAAFANDDWWTLLRAGLGMVALYGLFFLLALVYPAGMGFGDVKLAGVLGLYLGYLGWAEVVTGGFLGFLFGGVVGGGLMILHRAGRKSQIPFGPFMLAGALVAVLWGGALADLYLDHALA
ncbi:MAG: leader peptidase (prepilin peptidase) / N-methyltransferase [Actinomycetota bacterium]|jgi:leader peptidase (prepilin peptidase)/N-methyltransferase|nr:leader peptidase (prepilin peptidase) / N-methyltransferase [Actinomycetota bacterium]MDQ1643650.1 leader peptidase (prepilin peptidase) / N-methyltransferase [Actinomycetota bacterium]